MSFSVGRPSALLVFAEAAGAVALRRIAANATIEELLVKIKEEYRKLGPLLDLDFIGEAQGSRTKHRLAAGSRAVEHDRRPGA
jgi:hypothetical protein